MGKTREIKGRMKAVGNIKRITKTMQMIATARFQAAQRRAAAAKPYAQKIRELVGQLQAASGSESSGEAGGTGGTGGTGGGGGVGAAGHALFQSPAEPVGRRLLIVITSNRGMCGGYNASVLRTAGRYLEDHRDSRIDLDVVGKKALAYFKFAGVAVSNALTQIGDVPEIDGVYRLADGYIDTFTDGRYDQIAVAYMSFHSVARQESRILTLLPLQDAGEGDDPSPTPSRGQSASQTDYDFSPKPQELIGELLPLTVKTQLMQCFNEAAVGEQIARMVAMKSATESANKMGKSLARKYNRARQAAITTELSEIIAGSAALA